MSGHSKWSSIKHQKSKTDARRGRLFTKLIREITVAARTGGGDIDSNPRLRTAVAAAKAANMPAENIDKAIRRGTGDLPGVSYEEARYEGYGPGGVAIIVDVLTDNKNRTVAEIRNIFSKHNGNLGETGCVSWMFRWKGIITLSREKYPDEDYIMGIVLEAGAEDMKVEDDYYYIYTAPEELEVVRSSLEDAMVEIESAEISAVPQSTVKLEGKDAEKLLKLIDALDELDDVRQVSSNFEIEDALLEAYKNA